MLPRVQRGVTNVKICEVENSLMKIHSQLEQKAIAPTDLIKNASIFEQMLNFCRYEAFLTTPVTVFAPYVPDVEAYLIANIRDGNLETMCEAIQLLIALRSESLIVIFHETIAAMTTPGVDMVHYVPLLTVILTLCRCVGRLFPQILPNLIKVAPMSMDHIETKKVLLWNTGWYLQQCFAHASRDGGFVLAKMLSMDEIHSILNCFKCDDAFTKKINDIILYHLPHVSLKQALLKSGALQTANGKVQDEETKSCKAIDVLKNYEADSDENYMGRAMMRVGDLAKAHKNHLCICFCSCACCWHTVCRQCSHLALL